jgi:hypothetical protein
VQRRGRGGMAALFALETFDECHEPALLRPTVNKKPLDPDGEEASRRSEVAVRLLIGPGRTIATQVGVSTGQIPLRASRLLWRLRA